MLWVAVCLKEVLHRTSTDVIVVPDGHTPATYTVQESGKSYSTLQS